MMAVSGKAGDSCICSGLAVPIAVAAAAAANASFARAMALPPLQELGRHQYPNGSGLPHRRRRPGCRGQ